MLCIVPPFVLLELSGLLGFHWITRRLSAHSDQNTENQAVLTAQTLRTGGWYSVDT